MNHLIPRRIRYFNLLTCDVSFQVDLGTRASIVATAIQGRQDTNQWVTSYRVMYGDDGIRFRNYRPGRRGVRNVNKILN